MDFNGFIWFESMIAQGCPALLESCQVFPSVIPNSVAEGNFPEQRSEFLSIGSRDLVQHDSGHVGMKVGD